MQNGKQKYMVIYRNVLRVLSLWPPGKSSASQLIATLLWILKVCSQVYRSCSILQCVQQSEE